MLHGILYTELMVHVYYVYTVKGLGSVTDLWSVELSNKDMMILGIVVVNVVILMALCFVCLRSRWGKYRKYQRVVVGSGMDSDTEV